MKLSKSLLNKEDKQMAEQEEEKKDEE